MERQEKPKKKKKKAKKKSVGINVQGSTTGSMLSSLSSNTTSSPSFSNNYPSEGQTGINPKDATNSGGTLSVPKDSKLTPALSQDGNYIYILEGKIGRLDLNHRNFNRGIIGLCTDNFTSCNILIFISKDRKRYVLIHADQSIVKRFGENKLIGEQIKWLGQDPLLLNYRREDSGDPTQSSELISERLNQYPLEEILVPQEIEAIVIRVGESRPHMEKNLPKNIWHHPQSPLLFVSYLINIQFLGLSAIDESHLVPCIFDGTQWTSYPFLNLSDRVVKELILYKITKESSFIELFEFFLKHNPLPAEKGTPWNCVHERIIMYSANILIYYYLTQTEKPEPDNFLSYSFHRFQAKEIYVKLILDIRNRFPPLLNNSEQSDFITCALSKIKEGFGNDIAYYSVVPIRAYVTIFERFKSNISEFFSKKEDEKTIKLSAKSDPIIKSRGSSSSSCSSISSTPFFVRHNVKDMHIEAQEIYKKKDYNIAYGKYRKVLTFYEKAPNSPIKNKARAHYEMGVVCMELNKSDEALENLKKAKDLDPSTALYVKKYDDYRKSREEINQEHELS